MPSPIEPVVDVAVEVICNPVEYSPIHVVVAALVHARAVAGKPEGGLLRPRRVPLSYYVVVMFRYAFYC